MQFYPLTAFKWFHEDRLIAHYQPGLSYTVRPGNDLLAGKVQEWVAEGKVSLIPPVGAGASGVGGAATSGGN